MRNFSLFLLWIGGIFGSTTLFSQNDSTYYDFGDFGGIIYLDSLVVTASRSGFDVADFIQLVREDESFYQAFRNLRFLSYTADNDLEFFNKKKESIASYASITKQKAVELCRKMEIKSETSSGRFYKKRKKEYRYYTAKMFDRLFFTHQPTCESSKVPQHKSATKGMSKHVAELKQLIFQPGNKADIPIIGNKTAIFDSEMVDYYDFKISSKTYQNGAECYVFTAVVKEEFQERKKDKTVIKFLETYFDKESFQVIARNYHLFYQGALFDFDVTMNIDLVQLQGAYAPEKISYTGSWDVPGKKPETCNFNIRFYEFDE